MLTHPRLTGLFLLLVAMAILIIPDLNEIRDLLRFLGFLFCFVSGWMVLIFLWNDGDIAHLRRMNKDNMPKCCVFPVMPVRERTFRYPAMKGTRLAVMLSLGVFMLGIALAFFYLALISDKSVAENADGTIIYYVVSTLFLSFVLFLCWYSWRYSCLFIKVDSKGITASTYFGMRKVDWGEIIALRVTSSSSVYPGAGISLYKVYTINKGFSFSSFLLTDELVTLIAEATGLDWT